MRTIFAFLVSPKASLIRHGELIARSLVSLTNCGPLGSRRQILVLVVNELRGRVSTREADLKTHRGMRAPHALVLRHSKGVFEPPRKSDCNIVGIFKGLGLTGCETAKPGFSCK